MKYLIWLVVALAVVVWFQRAKKSMTAGTGQAGGNRGERNDGAEASARGAGNARGRFGRQRKQAVETMVQCAHCGIHFPVSEAVTNSAGAVFCSDDHLRLASS